MTILGYSLYELLFYFIIYSFLGWIVESSFKSLLFHKLINSGFLKGPFIPLYAFGALIVLTCFKPFGENGFVLFFTGMFFMTILEYLVGVLLEKVFNTRYWDYTGNFMNIGGKICLENSIYWGMFTVLLIKYMHPFFSSLINSIPIEMGERILAIFIIYFIIDYTSTIIEVLDIQEKVKMFLEIRDNSIIMATTEKISELRKHIIKKSRRLLRTFPRLTYLGINRRLKDIVKEIKKEK